MKIRQVIIIGIVLLSGIQKTFGQLDPLYNQYLFNQALFNPAYTGVNDAFHASAISRRQWIGVDGAPLTNTLNVSSSFMKNKIGAGLLIVSDQFGVNRNTEIHAMYSYQIEMLNSRSLSFGLQTGYITHQFDFTKLNLEQPDQALINIDNNLSQTNFGVGMYFQAENYYFGLSIPKILKTEFEDPNTTESRYKNHMYLSGGVLFDQLLIIQFKPSILIVTVEGKIELIDLNAQFLLMDALWVGASLRNFSTVGLNGQFQFKNHLRMGYSFEMPFNEITNTAFSTHELMVSIDMAIFKHQAVPRRYF